jgi:hypothetical protein
MADTSNFSSDDIFQATKAAIYANLGIGTAGSDRITTLLVNAIAAVVSAIPSVIQWIFSSIFGAAAAIATLWLGLVDTGVTDNREALNKVIAAALTEMLGVQIDPSDFQSDNVGGITPQELAPLGAKIMDVLESSFAPSGDVTPDSGAAAARAFLGFNVNLATRAGLLGLITELESLGFFKGFQDFGEDIVNSLGLGRLMRSAFRPMIKATITDPYTRSMNAKYRQTQLSPAEIFKAGFRDKFSDAEVQQHLAEHGYTDDFIAELQAQHDGQPGASEIELLIRFGVLDLTEGIKALQATGVSEDFATQKIQALQFARVERVETAYAGALLSAAQQRFITLDTFNSEMDKLHLVDAERQGYQNQLGLFLETPHKRLSLAQLIYLLERNQVTEEQIETWAQAEGYSADDMFTLQVYADEKDLEYETAQAAKAAAAKAKAAKAAAAAAKAAGKTT